MCPAINGHAFCDDSSTDPEFDYPALNKPKDKKTKAPETSLCACACAWSSDTCKCCTDDELEDD